jgi:hypothetical protein
MDSPTNQLEQLKLISEKITEIKTDIDNLISMSEGGESGSPDADQGDTVVEGKVNDTTGVEGQVNDTTGVEGQSDTGVEGQSDTGVEGQGDTGVDVQATQNVIESEASVVTTPEDSQTDIITPVSETKSQQGGRRRSRRTRRKKSRRCGKSKRRTRR